MEKNNEDTGIEFVKAMRDSYDFYISSSKYCTSTDKMDAAEEGLKIEGMLQLAITDL